MKIFVNKLKNVKLAKAEINLCQEVNPAFYDYAELKLLKPISFQGSIENVGDMLRLTGKFSGCLELVCNRCLEAFGWDFQLEINEVYSNKPEVVSDVADEDEEIIFFTGDEIDLAPQILRQIFLNIPMKVLCQKDCKGLCSGCGKNLNLVSCNCDRQNIDIRLEKLKDILNIMDKEV